MTKRKQKYTYTFESDGHGRMGKRWATYQSCANAIAEWIKVCALNDFYPAVKLIRVEENSSVSDD